MHSTDFLVSVPTPFDLVYFRSLQQDQSNMECTVLLKEVLGDGKPVWSFTDLPSLLTMNNKAQLFGSKSLFTLEVKEKTVVSTNTPYPFSANRELFADKVNETAAIVVTYGDTVGLVCLSRTKRLRRVLHP